MTQQVDLIGGWKSPEDWNIADKDQPPGRRKWFRLQLLPTALFRKPKGHAGISDF